MQNEEDDSLNSTESFAAISAEELAENISLYRKKFANTAGLWRRGLMTNEEVHREYSIYIHKGFTEFLDKHFLRHHLRWSNPEPWKRFCEDYELWKRGALLSRGNEDTSSPWLTYTIDLGPEDPKCGEEATLLDKSRFFELMEAFRIPAEHYRPAPEGIVWPDCRPGHYDWNVVIGNYIWEDDGGLLSEDFQLGSTITLTDHYGLKSVITVTDHLTTFEEKYRRKIYADYVGTGTVEGYTTSRERRIQIDVDQEKIVSFLMICDEADRDVYESFPLWQEALEFGRRKNIMWFDFMEDLLQYYAYEFKD